jgi:hypothetical protein
MLKKTTVIEEEIKSPALEDAMKIAAVFQDRLQKTKSMSGDYVNDVLTMARILYYRS